MGLSRHTFLIWMRQRACLSVCDLSSPITPPTVIFAQFSFSLIQKRRMKSQKKKRKKRELVYELSLVMTSFPIPLLFTLSPLTLLSSSRLVISSSSIVLFLNSSSPVRYSTIPLYPISLTALRPYFAHSNDSPRQLTPAAGAAAAAHSP